MQGQQYALYIYTLGSNIKYTNGSNTYNDGNIQLDLGCGKGGLFGSTFTPRTWNGTIYYSIVDNVPVVPFAGWSILIAGMLIGVFILIKKII